MFGVYDVEVTLFPRNIYTESKHYRSQVFGALEAIVQAYKASKCENVLRAEVTDVDTGEIMYTYYAHDEGSKHWVAPVCRDEVLDTLCDVM